MISSDIDVALRVMFDGPSVTIHGRWGSTSYIEPDSVMSDLERPVALTESEWLLFLRDITTPIARATLQRADDPILEDWWVQPMLAVHSVCD